MENTQNPRALDMTALAKSKTQLSGTTPLAELPRLQEDCHPESVDTHSGTVSWSVQSALLPNTQGQAAQWLHLEAQADVPLTCQRCLKAVSISLLIDQDFRFVADEATALAEDEDAEEDLLVLEDSFNLIDLIEDELLMSLPLVPMHPACLTELPASSEPDDALLDAKPNPFAVLAKLKTPQS